MPKGIITNMIKAYIRINDLNDIKTLHEAALSCKYDLVVQSGTKILNPKSLMGIFGLGTKKTVSLVAKYDLHWKLCCCFCFLYHYQLYVRATCLASSFR